MNDKQTAVEKQPYRIIPHVSVTCTNTGVSMSLELVMGELEHNNIPTPLDYGLNPASDVIWHFDADTSAASGWTWEDK